MSTIAPLEVDVRRFHKNRLAETEALFGVGDDSQVETSRCL